MSKVPECKVKSILEPLNDALNGMQAYMEAGQPIYDEVFYQEMAQCFNKLHPKLLQSVGAQWDGMIEYANAGGDLGTIHLITSSIFWGF